MLLAATVWSFAHLLLGLSNHNNVVLWPRCEGGARCNLHKRNVAYDRCCSLQKGRDVVATSQLTLRWKCDAPRTGCEQRATHKYMWRKQATIKWSRWVISIVACCHSVELCTPAARAFWSQHKKYTSCLSYAQHMKMTRDEHVLGIGFKSFNISIYWWIWMLSFLVCQIWIWIDDLLLDFFATFGSVLGLQVTVTFGSVLGLQVTVL